MSDVPEKLDGAGDDGLLKRLIRETGITEAEASDLVMMLGPNWSSLVREARLLKRRDASAADS